MGKRKNKQNLITYKLLQSKGNDNKMKRQPMD